MLQQILWCNSKWLLSTQRRYKNIELNRKFPLYSTKKERQIDPTDSKIKIGIGIKNVFNLCQWKFEIIKWTPSLFEILFSKLVYNNLNEMQLGKLNKPRHSATWGPKWQPIQERHSFRLWLTNPQEWRWGRLQASEVVSG